MVKRSILAHHLNKVHLVRFRVENFLLRVLCVELWSPSAFEIRRVCQHNLRVRRDVGWREKLRDVRLGRHADKVVDLLQRFIRLLQEIQAFDLVDNDFFNARINLNFFGKIKAIDGGELDGSVGLVVIATTVLEFIAVEDLSLASRPVELQNFLEENLFKNFGLINSSDLPLNLSPSDFHCQSKPTTARDTSWMARKTSSRGDSLCALRRGSWRWRLWGPCREFSTCTWRLSRSWCPPTSSAVSQRWGPQRVPLVPQPGRKKLSSCVWNDRKLLLRQFAGISQTKNSV